MLLTRSLTSLARNLVSIGPDYKIDPDLTDRRNSKGKTFTVSMPAAYTDGTKAALLVIHDGAGQLKLISSGRERHRPRHFARFVGFDATPVA